MDAYCPQRDFSVLSLTSCFLHPTITIITTHRPSAMSLKPRFSLPFDLVVLVGEHLPLHDLAAFLRVNRCFAELLTPLLNRSALLPLRRKAALLYAAANGNRDLVHLLVTTSRCVLARKNDARMTIICMAPARHRIKDVVDEIMLQGRRLIVQDTSTFCTPLHDATRARKHTTLSALLELGAETSVHDFRGWTALHYASWENDFVAVTLLLRHGAPVNALNDDEMSPLHLSAHIGSIAITGLLLSSGADPALRDTNDHTPIELTESRDNDLDTLLLRSCGANFRSSTNQTALHMASCLGDLSLVTTLIRAGVPINTRDHFGGTALHEASAAGHPTVVSALLHHGANVNAQDCDGTTPLHCAATEDVAIALLAHNPNMAILNGCGDSALDYDTFEPILRHADPAMRMRDDRTPLHIAIVQASVECVRDLIDRGADTEAVDDQGRTPLHVAAAAGNREMMKVLLRAGANIDARNKDGKTPLEVFEYVDK